MTQQIYDFWIFAQTIHDFGSHVGPTAGRWVNDGRGYIQEHLAQEVVEVTNRGDVIIARVDRLHGGG